MVIGEALNNIKDLEKKRAFIKERISQNTFILNEEENSTPSIENLIKEYGAVCEEIANLKASIIVTNATTNVNVIEKGENLTIIQLIKKIENIKDLESTYRLIVERITDRSNRFHGNGFGEERIKLQLNCTQTIEELVSQADYLRKTARDLEKILIKTNWQTEVISI
jgi:hypothetical protein